MFVDHHTVDHGGLAGVVKVQMDASPWFNQVVINFSAGFVHVTNRLVEYVSKTAVGAFRADYDLVCLAHTWW